jgi:uncharacterized OB-fold protein
LSRIQLETPNADTVWPIPQVNDDNRAFWTSGRDGTLRIARCDDCGYYVHPPTPRCPRCLRENVKPRPVSGRGRVYTYTINERAWVPGSEVPYVIAIVELDEQVGLRLMTNIVGCRPQDVVIDMQVRVQFRERGEVFLPVFGAA